VSVIVWGGRGLEELRLVFFLPNVIFVFGGGGGLEQLNSSQFCLSPF